MLTFCHLVLGRFAKHQSDEVYCDGPPEPLLEEPERQRATDPSLWQLVARLFGSFWASPQLGYPQIPYGVSTFPILSPLNWQVLEYRGINKFQTPPFDNMTISHIYIYAYIYIYSLCRKETAWSRYSYNFATNVCTNSQTAHLVNPAKGVAALHFALNGA